MKKILASLIVTAIVLPTSLSAQQRHCAVRDKVIQKLEANYGESFGGGGVQNSKHIFEVWFSTEKGTWTILMTRADGTTCIMASGTDWRDALPGDAKPAGVPS